GEVNGAEEIQFAVRDGGPRGGASDRLEDLFRGKKRRDRVRLLPRSKQSAKLGLRSQLRGLTSPCLLPGKRWRLQRPCLARTVRKPLVVLLEDGIRKDGQRPGCRPRVAKLAPQHRQHGGGGQAHDLVGGDERSPGRGEGQRR